MAQFWWQKSNDRKGLHLYEWGKMCVLKNEGGLGFQSFAKFNIALLEKQGWRLFNNPNSLLAQVLKVKYYLSTKFLNSNLKVGASYSWKSIWASKKVLVDGLC